MASITSTYIESENRVKFIVSIDIGDVINWAVYVGAKHDHGQGSQSGDCPYFVERITGIGSMVFYRPKNSLYFPDNYCAELALHGTGVVDYSTFTIPVVVAPISITIKSVGNGCVDVYQPRETKIDTVCGTKTFNLTPVGIFLVRLVAKPGTGDTYINACFSTSGTCMTASDFAVSNLFTGGTITFNFTNTAPPPPPPPPTQKWKCTDPATNTCAQTADGTYDTEALCKAATSCHSGDGYGINYTVIIILVVIGLLGYFVLIKKKKIL